MPASSVRGRRRRSWHAVMNDMGVMAAWKEGTAANAAMAPWQAWESMHARVGVWAREKPRSHLLHTGEPRVEVSRARDFGVGGDYMGHLAIMRVSGD